MLGSCSAFAGERLSLTGTFSELRLTPEGGRRSACNENERLLRCRDLRRQIRCIPFHGRAAATNSRLNEKELLNCDSRRWLSIRPALERT
jgi:hypothetical protein